MLFGATIGIYCQHKKHIHTLCDKMQFISVTVGGGYSYHWVLKRSNPFNILNPTGYFMYHKV